MPRGVVMSDLDPSSCENRFHWQGWALTVRRDEIAIRQILVSNLGYESILYTKLGVYG